MSSGKGENGYEEPQTIATEPPEHYLLAVGDIVVWHDSVFRISKVGEFGARVEYMEFILGTFSGGERLFGWEFFFESDYKIFGDGYYWSAVSEELERQAARKTRLDEEWMS